jgi:hypothetical protein
MLSGTGYPSGTGMELFFYPHAGTGNPTGKILRVRVWVRVSTTRRVRTRCHLDPDCSPLPTPFHAPTRGPHRSDAPSESCLKPLGLLLLQGRGPLTATNHRGGKKHHRKYDPHTDQMEIRFTRLINFSNIQLQHLQHTK